MKRRRKRGDVKDNANRREREANAGKTRGIVNDEGERVGCSCHAGVGSMACKEYS